MRTNITDVYCAGDLTSFPLQMIKDQSVSVAHWQTAQAQGNHKHAVLFLLRVVRHDDKKL